MKGYRRLVTVCALGIALAFLVVGVLGCGGPEETHTAESSVTLIEEPTLEPTRTEIPPTPTEGQITGPSMTKPSPTQTEVPASVTPTPLVYSFAPSTKGSLCNDLNNIDIDREIGASDLLTTAVKGEIILSGKLSDFNFVIGVLTPQGFLFTQTLVIDLPKMGLGSSSNIEVIALYQINRSINETVTEFNQIAMETLMAEQRLPVAYAEPNHIFGSPWDGEGSPWDGEGSPWTFTMTIASEDAIDLYWNQLALRQAGLSSGITAGAGKVVLVFDTSPFPRPGEYTFDLGYDRVKKTPLELCVAHPFDLQVSHPYSATRNHGLFVSGLVHAMAPESEIYLLQVLQDDARGDAFTLLVAMAEAMRVMCERTGTSDTCDGALRDSVLNLSLGFRPEAGMTISEFDEEQYDAFLEFLHNVLGLEDYTPEREKEPIPVIAMKAITLLAKDLEGSPGHAGPIVASAGNRRNQTMDHPAIFTDVMGIAAGRIMDVALEDTPQSCYSNNGDLIFPGGDGELIFQRACQPPINGPFSTQLIEDAMCTDEGFLCTSATDFCGKMVIAFKDDCPYGALSLGLTLDQEGFFGFGFWAGSSFAAPLASGYYASQPD